MDISKVLTKLADRAVKRESHIKELEKVYAKYVTDINFNLHGMEITLLSFDKAGKIRLDTSTDSIVLTFNDFLNLPKIVEEFAYKVNHLE